jgi:arylsulfatase A-like enzyme
MMVSMKRRAFLSSLAAASLSQSALNGQRPNIILIMTDDQGYGDVARHGNPVIETPNLDRLHDESVRLLDFHVSPTCAPTRSSLLTGRHEFKNGISHTIFERERMSLKSTTIAQVLRQAGYSTGIFGKWHLGDAEPYQPGRRGFQEVFIHGCGGIGQRYAGTCADAPNNSYFDPYILHNGRFEKTKGYCTDVFFAQATRWIGEQKRPFFAYITPNAPHAPLDCPPEYEAKYTAKVPSAATAKYFGMVTNIDDNVGRLLDFLKTKNLERDTLVIFMNDNGGTGGVRVFNDGMRGAKNTPYLGGTRAMGFFRWPGTLQPAAVKALTAHVDMFPTLAALAGAKVPASPKLDGRSLTPLLENPDAAWPDRFLFTHIGRWEKGKAAQSKYQKCRIRNTRYSMVNMGSAWELYDLATDRGEQRDVAAQNPAVVKQLSAAYDKWWDEILPLLENENAVPPATPPYHELFEKQFPIAAPAR